MNNVNIRQEQRAYAATIGDSIGNEVASPTSVRRSILSRSKLAPSKLTPKGHEAFLKGLETSGAVCCFEKASSGEKIIWQGKDLR